MANRQTRSLRKAGMSLTFHKGVDFSHMDRVGGSARHTHPEFTIHPMVTNPRRKKLGATRHTPTLSLRDQTALFNHGLGALRKKAA